MSQTPQDLMAAAAAKANQTSTTSKVESKSNESAYQFPSAPTNFVLPSGRRVLVPDGVHKTNNAEEIEYLEKMVEVGNIWPASYSQEIQAQIPQAQVPAPISTDKVN